jgi:hypothetical protein
MGEEARKRQMGNRKFNRGTKKKKGRGIQTANGRGINANGPFGLWEASAFKIPLSFYPNEGIMAGR